MRWLSAVSTATPLAAAVDEAAAAIAAAASGVAVETAESQRMPAP